MKLQWSNAIVCSHYTKLQTMIVVINKRKSLGLVILKESLWAQNGRQSTQCNSHIGVSIHSVTSCTFWAQHQQHSITCCKRWPDPETCRSLASKHACTYEQSHTYDIANKYSVHSRNCSTSLLRYQQMAKLKRLHDNKLISSWQISCLRSEMISMEHAN